MSYLDTTHDVYKEAALTTRCGLVLHYESYLGVAGFENTQHYAANELRLWQYGTRSRFDE